MADHSLRKPKPASASCAYRESRTCEADVCGHLDAELLQPHLVAVDHDCVTRRKRRVQRLSSLRRIRPLGQHLQQQPHALQATPQAQILRACTRCRVRLVNFELLLRVGYQAQL